MNLTSLHTPMAADPEVALARRADALIAGVLCGAWLMAWWVGAQHMGGVAAWWLGLPLLLATAAVVVLRPGTLVSRLALSVGLMGMVGLHIHLGAGTPEYHFGVFVTLALLLMYRDWRPIVCAAVTIAVHHVVTDRLQAAGWGVYCLSRPDYGKVLQHAAYVVVQTAVEVRMAVMLQQDARLRTELSASLQDTLASLHGAVRSVMQSVDGVHSASHQIASGSADLSDRADETASQLRRATSLMTELTQAASDTAASAHNANALAASAAQVAQQGGEVVAGVVETMNQISTASSKIADIIGVIDGIAFQTNILALNAAVEAARAGEQGRGFAVVATEVRALAQRSADAAKEIKSLIGASVEQVEGGTKRVQEAGETMRAIVTSVLQVTEMIREMSEATQAQRQGLVQVNGAVSALEAVTQQNAALAEQSASSAQDLQAQADRLSQAVVDMGGTAVATQATV